MGLIVFEFPDPKEMRVGSPIFCKNHSPLTMGSEVKVIEPSGQTYCAELTIEILLDSDTSVSRIVSHSGFPSEFSKRKETEYFPGTEVFNVLEVPIMAPDSFSHSNW